MLVFGDVAAPRRAPRRGRAADPEPAAVDVVRATVAEAAPLGEPEAWLRAAGEDTVTAALAVLNSAFHAHRIAAADPFVAELAAGAALVTRAGYGTGEEIAEGRWTEAREIAYRPPRVRREAALRPQERFAALLGARDVALACELLALRARLDLDRGRAREAALQLDAALAAALAELEAWRTLDGMPARLEELRGLEPRAAAAAAAARAGTLDPETTDAVAATLARLEAALRARTAAAPF